MDPVAARRALQSVLGSLVEPAALLAWALVALAWLARRSRQRALFGAALAVLVAYLAIATPLAATAWVRAWESRADALPACAEPGEGAVLVVLAGGMKAGVRDATDATGLSEASLRRTLAAARLARAQPSTKVIVSGGFGDAVREADLMRALLVETGIDPARVVVERESRNTAENARNTAGLVAGRGWVKAPFALVTSALHMPRALATFRHAGIDACAVVVDSRAEPGSAWKAWIPGAGAIADSEAVAHEIIGMAAYRALGNL